MLISTLSAAACVTYLYFGFYFFAQRPQSSRHRYFLLFNLSFAFWSLSYAVIAGSGDPAVRHLWTRLGYLGALGYEVPMLEFFLRHTGAIQRIRRPRLLSAVLWIVPLLWIYMNLVHDSIQKDFPSGFWYIGLHVFANSYNLITIALIFLWVRSSKLKRERRQGVAIIVGGLVTIVLSLFSDFIFGLLGLPTITPVIILGYIGVLFYAAVRYRFLGISDEYVNRLVLESMDDLVVVLDREGRLLKRGLLPDPDCGAREHASAGDLFMNSAELERRLQSLDDSRRRSCRMFLLQRSPEGPPREIRAECSRIRDSFGDVIGTLITGKTCDRTADLQRCFGLSKRETEIVQLLLCGKTLKAIADELGIRQNTVKTHTTNIYNKTGVSSRIELIGIADAPASPVRERGY